MARIPLKNLTLRVPLDTYNALQNLAEIDGSTITDQLRRAVMLHIEGRDIEKLIHERLAAEQALHRDAMKAAMQRWGDQISAAVVTNLNAAIGVPAA
ncbi:MAG: hypothetical protein EPN70_10090 [Paraburkholderia sp.]|uniref:hypothetical protein n=1 Tax=Paraburkholderia sp. TaxID=1926495 RepID=UPI0011FADCAB|nr:hypothetical protein [Paraburkholderia sp.]TAM04905.1 MAG: hypothetical protein EPN70_10090 [Paraburkholderia sp.]TAM29591.1 MAG: hypothetical protein EPN59_11625 [Paraburkholderia sp.]